MDVASLLQTWGYPALFIGTLLEGETVLLLAGFAAHAGYLSFPWVVAIAAAGGLAGEQIWFLLGRRYGERILERFPRLRPRAERMRALLARYHMPIILTLRFMYGLRTVGPMAIGMSPVTWSRFTALDCVAALLWASIVGSIGYAFGQAAALWLGQLKHFEPVLAALLVAAGLALWWLRFRMSRQ